MMEQRMNVWTKPAGFAVFAWRFVLTTGTGLIFAFLLARQAYGSALLPPMFIVLSFAWGLAVFHVVQTVIYAWNEKVLDPTILQRKKNLLGVFVLGSLYMVATYHFTNLYFANRIEFEHFILFDGGLFPNLFWWGYVFLGNVLPLALIYLPGLGQTRCVMAASMAVVLGAFIFLYVFIIGGQAFPLSIFPGFEVTSTFADGQINEYHPSVYEFLLGMMGLAIAFMITTVSVRVLNFMPQDKHYIAD
jgi:molybdopterin-containing oxidoreductase family membrane subunit